jgi:tRNA G18 (ribose-2'-O)-methylase SpoU
MSRGYFGIGIEHNKTPANLGTLWRSAKLFGAAFIFTIGRRYERQPSDTQKTWRHCPLMHFQDIDAFNVSRPFDCPLVGIELAEGSRPLASFRHPQRAVYLLGAEDHGLTKKTLAACQSVVQLEAMGNGSLNVAVAGSILLWHRFTGHSVSHVEGFS